MKKAKVLLIGAEDEENLALRYLAAVLEKEGHKVKIVPCSQYKDFTNVFKTVTIEKPQLIGISIAFQQLAMMYFELISKIRNLGYKGHITIGGHFPTFEYKKILETQKDIDTVIRFEGERPIVELIRSIQNNEGFSKVTNLVYRSKSGLIENTCVNKFQILDDLPFPVRGKTQTRIGEKFATLVASRGCWHASCLYCCIGAFHSKKEGQKFTIRSPESVAEEIALLYHNKKVRVFQFHDDNFMLPSRKETVKRFKNLTNELKKRKVDINKIAFLIKARPDTIDDKVAHALKDLGTVGVFLGIENASETGLKALIRSSTLENIHRALSALKKYGIIVTYNLLIFHPNATIEEISENIEFIRKYPYLPFDVARAEIVSGSPLERLVNSKKTLIGTWPNWGYMIDNPKIDKMFEIYLKSFRRKGSLCQKLAQYSIVLAYRTYTIKKFYNGKIAKEIASDATKMISNTSLFLADNIEKMRDMSINNCSEEDIIKFDEELFIGCKKRLEELKRIKDRMTKLQIAEKAFDFFGVKGVPQQTRIFRRLFGY